MIVQTVVIMANKLERVRSAITVKSARFNYYGKYAMNWSLWHNASAKKDNKKLAICFFFGIIENSDTVH